MARDDRRPAGRLVGDLSIFTFYKNARPTGRSPLLFRDGLDGLAQRAGLGLGRVGIRHAEWPLARSALLTDLEDRLRPALKRGPREVDPATGGDAPGNLDIPPARTTRFLHPRLVDATVAERRRRNYQHLLMELGDVVASPFARLPAGACPWAFMVEAEDKQSLMNRALLHRIRAIDLWYQPHPSLPAHRSIKHVHYERDSSGFPFTMSFANAIWRGCGRRSETPSSRTRGHSEVRVSGRVRADQARRRSREQACRG
jgi:hypothetical protein